MSEPTGRWEDGLYLIDDEAWLPAELCQRCQAEPIVAFGFGSRCLRVERPIQPVRHPHQAEYCARPEVRAHRAEYRARPEVKAAMAANEARYHARPEVKAHRAAQRAEYRARLARLRNAFGGDPS